MRPVRSSIPTAGRTSLVPPVGLRPLALLGADCETSRVGAADLACRCESAWFPPAGMHEARWVDSNDELELLRRLPVCERHHRADVHPVERREAWHGRRH